ncbi:MAG TPA: hypothetical protein VHB53_01935 [Solirubrobacterales bacterium]|nr:hypothetical protein [Solirubrobacterales bacterium]
MDPIEKRELKRQAWRRIAAQRRRAGLLRGRVVALSLVCFALLWGIVFVQMATGNDPVLASKEKAVVAHKERVVVARTRPSASEEAAPESEEAEPEPEPEPVEEAEPEPEEAEPEPVEEPLVTSQS